MSFFRLATMPDEVNYRNECDGTSQRTNESASSTKQAAANAAANSTSTTSIGAGDVLNTDGDLAPHKRINVAVIGDTESGRTSFIKSLKKKKLWSVYSVVDAFTNYSGSSPNSTLDNSFFQFEELSSSYTSPKGVRGTHTPSNVFMMKNVLTAPFTARIKYATGTQETAKSTASSPEGKKESVEVLISEAGSIPLVAEIGNGAARTLPNADFVFLLFPLTQVKQVSKGRDSIHVSRTDKELLCDLFATAYSQLQQPCVTTTSPLRRTFLHVVGTYKNSLLHTHINAVQEVLHTLRAFVLQQTQFSSANDEDTDVGNRTNMREILISDFFGADLSDGSCISLDGTEATTVAEMFSKLVKQYAQSMADIAVTPIQLLEAESEVADAKKVVSLVSNARNHGDFFLLERHELCRYFFTCGIVGLNHIRETLSDAQQKGVLTLMQRWDTRATTSPIRAAAQPASLSFSSICLFPSLLANIIASPFLYYDAFYHHKEQRELLLLGVSLKKCRAADSAQLSSQGILPFPSLQQLSAGVFSAHLLVEDDETPEDTRRRSANLVKLYMRTLEEAEVAFALEWDFGIYKSTNSSNTYEDGPRPTPFTLDEPTPRLPTTTGAGVVTSLSPPSVKAVSGSDSILSDGQTPTREVSSPTTLTPESSGVKRQQLFTSLLGIFSPTGLNVATPHGGGTTREAPLFYSTNKTDKKDPYDSTSNMVQEADATTFLVVPALREHRLCPQSIVDGVSSSCRASKRETMSAGDLLYSCLLQLRHAPRSFFYTLVCRLASMAVIGGLYGDAVFMTPRNDNASPFSCDIRGAVFWSNAPVIGAHVECMYEKELHLVVYDVGAESLPCDTFSDLQMQKILFLQRLKDAVFSLHRDKFPGTQILARHKFHTTIANVREKLCAIDKAVEWSV